MLSLRFNVFPRGIDLVAAGVGKDEGQVVGCLGADEVIRAVTASTAVGGSIADEELAE